MHWPHKTLFYFNQNQCRPSLYSCNSVKSDLCTRTDYLVRCSKTFQQFAVKSDRMMTEFSKKGETLQHCSLIIWDLNLPHCSI